MKTNIPSPLFDTLDHFLDHTDYKPNLSPVFQADFEQAKQFLLNYRGSPDTFNAYRREIERFLQWCFLIKNQSIQHIQRKDFEMYLDFCQNPPQTWITLRVENRFIEKEGIKIPNTQWRPFVSTISKTEIKLGKRPNKKNYELSEKAFKAIFAVVSSFYNYLIQEQWAPINPVLLIRQKSKYYKKKKTHQTIRRLSELQWAYVIETAEHMALENPKYHARTLFLMNALYGMYLRISECVATHRWTPTMGDFFRDADGLWWFVTIGKGNKERKISVSNAMLDALKQYRLTLGLSPTPIPHEKTPLFYGKKPHEPLKNTRYVRKIVQVCFDRACERLLADQQGEEAQQLAQATVHWLRHTGISDDVKIRPREHVRDDAGHSSSAITDKYIDIELRERHQSAKQKRIKPICLE